MGFEDNIEKGKSSGKPSVSSKMTLQKAIELGEYNPDYLSTFPEWLTLSRHIKFQYIRDAIESRRRHLITQYAEINNILDFSKKPHLKEALKNNKETAFVALDLVETKKDVDIDFKIEDCKFGDFNQKELEQEFEKLEFNTLINRIASLNNN